MHRRIIAAIAFSVLAWTSRAALAQTRQTPAAATETQSPTTPIAAHSGASKAAAVKPEDWTALSLDKSNLPLSLFGGPVLSKIEAPEYTRELIRLQWRAGDPIEVYVVLPKGVKNPPVIVYLYDFTSDAARFRDDGWCKRMTKNGIAAVGFNTAVSGDRLHTPRPMKQWFVSELQEALGSSVHDVSMVLNYLDKRGDIDTKSVGLFGQGSGGAIALLAAAADPRVSAVDVMDPWGDWPDWLKNSQQVPEEERALYLTPEFLHKVAGLDPVTYLPQLKLKALRVQQVLDDTVTPEAARDKIRAAVPKPDEVVRYKDWSALRTAYSATGLSAWLQAQLRPATAGPERAATAAANGAN